MAFQRDENFAIEIDPAFGQYLTSFTSEPKGQVRADLFRSGRYIMAYVSYPTGLNGLEVSEPYVPEIREFAQKEGAGEHYRIYNT